MEINSDKKAVKEISKFVSKEICKQVKKAINELNSKEENKRGRDNVGIEN